MTKPSVLKLYQGFVEPNPDTDVRPHANAKNIIATGHHFRGIISLVRTPANPPANTLASFSPLQEFRQSMLVDSLYLIFIALILALTEVNRQSIPRYCNMLSKLQKYCDCDISGADQM